MYQKLVEEWLQQADINGGQIAEVYKTCADQLEQEIIALENDKAEIEVCELFTCVASQENPDVRNGELASTQNDRIQDQQYIVG